MQPLTPDQQQLVEDHLYVARRLAGQYVRNNGRASYDEAESAAFEGLCHAASRFDPSKGVKFHTYCRQRCRGAIMDYVRDSSPGSRYRRVYEHSLAVRLERECGDDVEIDFNTCTPPLDVELLDFWDLACRGLDERERTALTRYFRDGLTMSEIGFELELSESRISQMLGKVKNRITERLENWRSFDVAV